MKNVRIGSGILYVIQKMVLLDDPISTYHK